MIHSLFIQPNNHGEYLSVHAINIIAHLGIENDCHQNILSPRHVLFTSLESIKSLGLKPGDLHENIVVENFNIDGIQSGSVIFCGEAKFRVTFNCEVCNFINTLGLRKTSDVINKRGILAVALNNATVNVGDKISVKENIFAPVPSKLSDRIVWLVEQIPKGKVLTYMDIITIAGGPRSVVRVIPTILKRAQNSHRVINSAHEASTQFDGQEQLLLNEGILIENGVVPEKYLWDTRNLFYMKLP